MWDVSALLAGIALAALGGRIFVRGAVGLAAAWRVPAGVIGATVAAFATSAPELAVGVNAALAGTPEVAAGDALGSNVVNIALVVGAVLVLGPLAVERRGVRRDLPLAAGAPVLLGVLALDGTLGRRDGLALITVFGVWVTSTVLQAMRERDRTAEVIGERESRRALLATFAGLAALLAAGRLVVVGAVGIGEALGLHAFLVGATLVAFGTSMPELATSLVARFRGHGELGLATVIGSNIFNTLLIVGVAATLHPFALPPAEIRVAAAAGCLLALALIPRTSGVLGQRRGALLLASYVAYLAVLIATQVE